MVKVRECYHNSYVVCVVVFQLSEYYLDNNYLYHMTKCNLMLVVCRSWNHNIDTVLCITKVLM